MNYTDLVVKLPEKCLDILGQNEIRDIDNNREVTHMLALAMASLVIPFERLQQGHLSNDKHNQLYTVGALHELQNDKIVSSEKLWDKSMNSWRYGEIEGEFCGLKDKIQEGNMGSDIKECGVTVDQFLRVLRNSLAHGNIFFGSGEEPNSPIKQLVFLTKKKEKISKQLKKKCAEAIGEVDGDEAHALRVAIDSAKTDLGYKYLFVEPQDFRKFLSIWIRFLQTEVKIPEMLDAA